eukprot:3068949-Ditylum_brightwellii.AAC.1
MQFVKATPKEEGSARPNAKLAKRLIMTGTKNPHVITLLSKGITIASTMDITTTPRKSLGSPSINTKDTLVMKGSKNPITAR